MTTTLFGGIDSIFLSCLFARMLIPNSRRDAIFALFLSLLARVHPSTTTQNYTKQIVMDARELRVRRVRPWWQANYISLACMWPTVTGDGDVSWKFAHRTDRFNYHAVHDPPRQGDFKRAVYKTQRNRLQYALSIDRTDWSLLPTTTTFTDYPTVYSITHNTNIILGKNAWFGRCKQKGI